MNDDSFGGELHAWIEPELEARMVAMILGEASDFEIDELERLMEERPELRIFKRRLEVVHGLLGEAVKPGDDEDWGLAPERRAALLEAIGVLPQAEEPEEVVVLSIDDARERRVRRAGLKVALMAAACLMISLLLAPFFMTGATKSGFAPMAEDAKREREDSRASGSRMVGLSTELPQAQIEGTPKTIRLPDRTPDPAGGVEIAGGVAIKGGNLNLHYNGHAVAPADSSAPEGDVRSKLAELKKNIGTGTLALQADPDGPDEVRDLRGYNYRDAGRPLGQGLTWHDEKPADGPGASIEVIREAGYSAEPSEKPEPVPAPDPKTATETFGRSWHAPVAGKPLADAAKSESAPVPTARPKRAPAKPTEVAAKVIAAATPEPTAPPAPPVPELGDVPASGVLFDTSEDFGTADDFGDGWGSGGGGGGFGGEDHGVVKEGKASGPASTESLSFLAGKDANDRTRRRELPSESAELDAETAPSLKLPVEPPEARTDKLSRTKTPLGEERPYDRQRARGEAIAEDLVEETSDDFFVGGGTVGGAMEGEKRGGRDFINPVRATTIPGVPAGEKQDVSNLVTGGLRSGDAAITRNSIDAILNGPGRTKSGADENGAAVDTLALNGGFNANGDRLEELQSGLEENWKAKGPVDKDGDGLGGDGRRFGNDESGLAGNSEAARFGEWDRKSEATPEGDESGGTTGLAWRGRAKSNPGDDDEFMSFADTTDAKQRDGERQAGQEVAERASRSNRGGGEVGSIIEREALRRHASVTDAEKDLHEGRDAYAKGEYEEAVTKSAYYRAAYDETRARMLAEVDKAWETEVPPAPPQEEAEPASAGGLLGILGTQQELVENRLEKMAQVVSDRRDVAVDKALESHDYIEAKREYASAQQMLQSMKLQHSAKRIGLKIPKSPITVHDKGSVKKKSGGFLGLGKKRYEGNATVQINPTTPELDAFGGNLGNQNAGGAMTRQFFATEFEVIAADQTLKKVVKDLNLERKWGTNEADAIKRLKGKVKTEQVRGTDLVNIKVEEKNAAEAKQIAGKVAEAYKERRTKMEQERAERALKSLDGELRDQEDLVEEKRKVLDTIVQAVGIPYVEGVIGSGEMGRSQERIYELAELNYFELEKEQQQLDIQIKRLLKLKGDEQMRYAAGLQIPGNPVAKSYAEYQDAVRDLESVKASGLGADHPDVKMRALSVANLRADLEKSVGSVGAALQAPDREANERRAKRKAAVEAELKRRQEAEAKRLAEQQKKEALREMEKSAAEEAFSTFSLHVSDVSFKLAQAALAKGQWPEAARVRVEEFVNAFDYGDPAPSQDEKVACVVEQAAHPFMQQRNLVRISMRTAAVGRASGTPLRLTVLLDNSGSMDRADRMESVRNAFQLLAAQLNPEDQVNLISFARTPRLLRDGVAGDKVAELANVIDETPSEGGTNIEEALRLGLEKASERMQEGAQSRIILLTDGAANLGNAEPEDLAKLVEEMRQKGIAFDACGVGAEGLNDDVLEALTRKGDGRYYFLDRPEDADAGFAKQIAGALRPAAKNVKVQVEFNPKRVGHYRLYGFEKHELKKEDFRNDSVDAAELAAEEAGVAIYQVEPLPDGEGDIGSVSVRFRDMTTGEMIEKRWPIPYEANAARLAEAEPSMQLAGAAALFGEKLKGSPLGETVELGELSGVSRALQAVYPSNQRVGQLVDMIEKAREMTR